MLSTSRARPAHAELPWSIRATSDPGETFGGITRIENGYANMDTQLNTIGLIGAGNIGSQLARLAIGQGYDVVLSNSRGPDTLTGLVAELGPKARAATAADAAQAGDVVVVTIPLKNYAQVPVQPLAGKIVIDTCNYYPQRDEQIPQLDTESSTTSELLQAHLPDSYLVKAFNNIYSGHLTTDGTPTGTSGRRALPIAGDNDAAKTAVTALIDEFGFDVVDAGPLAEGWRFQRDTAAYVKRFDADTLRAALTRAKRYAQM